MGFRSRQHGYLHTTTSTRMHFPVQILRGSTSSHSYSRCRRFSRLAFSHWICLRTHRGRRIRQAQTGSSRTLQLHSGTVDPLVILDCQWYRHGTVMVMFGIIICYLLFGKHRALRARLGEVIDIDFIKNHCQLLRCCLQPLVLFFQSNI